MTAARAGVAGPRQSRGRRVALLTFLGVSFLGFVALGTWQVERRSWKLALIDRVERRVAAPASAAPLPSEWRELNDAADAYRHVRLTGRFVPGADTLVQAVTRLGAGHWVLTPFQSTDGGVVLVNRGFVPGRTARPPSASLSGLTGLLRMTEPGGGFLHRNDPAAGRWYSRDVQAIARARGLARVAPYFVDADAPPTESANRPDDEPVGGLTVVSFHNSHLVYAVTWYLLALLTLAGGWQVVREERRPGRPALIRP